MLGILYPNIVRKSIENKNKVPCIRERANGRQLGCGPAFISGDLAIKELWERPPPAITVWMFGAECT